jgi:hypothetical protein
MTLSLSHVARIGRAAIAATTLAMAVATLWPAAPAFAQSYWQMTCRQLWYERNSYYKAHGYCFKTREAIATFGNDGCYVEYEGQIRFSPAERRAIEMIRAAERDRGCN